MNIKRINFTKNINNKARLCALTLASAVTITGCSKINNDSSENQTQIPSYNTIMEDTESIYLDENHPEIYRVEYLSNNEKRGIIMSEEPHLYESMFEKTNTKVFLSDKNGNRLSDNFDQLSTLKNYQYLTVGGVLLGDWAKVKTDKEYDCFVGVTLRKSSDDKTLNPTITLLDKNGLVLHKFNGYFKALMGSIVVIQDYHEDHSTLGEPDTYLYDYSTEKKSESHQYVNMFSYYDDEATEKHRFIGVDYSSSNENLYSLYDKDLNVIAQVSENEIEDWYESEEDYNSYDRAGDNCYAYFESIYKNKEKEREKRLILKED